jgi:hypothetical protein
MPLQGDEVIELGEEALKVCAALRLAIKPDSSGGKRVTKAEALELVQLMLPLAGHILRSIAD